MWVISNKSHPLYNLKGVLETHLVGPLADIGAVARRKISEIAGNWIPRILSSARSLVTVVIELPIIDRERMKLLIFLIYQYV